MDRRTNWVGRWVVTLHVRYCWPPMIPVLWVLVVLLGIAQVIAAAWS